MKRAINLLQEWSIPLIAGVFFALLVANVAPHFYHVLVDEPFTQWDTRLKEEHDAQSAELPAVSDPLPSQPADAGEAHAPEEHAPAEGDHGGGHGHGWEHYITLHFLINDIFMVFFFGIATKEIVESVLPGGPLNPPSKAVNPLLATVGGVVGPICVFFALNAVIGKPGFGPDAWGKGWGIPTATDIALAWLVARMVFGSGHPAISFLLLLAVADDAIGLGIIAFGYPDPNNPTVWANALWIIPGMAIAFGLRKMKVKSWVPYILIGGAFSWWGLFSAHLHPALALVPIVPFLPTGKIDPGLFLEEEDYDREEAVGHHHSPMENFEHQLKLPVDFGLFFFAFANAGVEFSAMNNLTWIVFCSLLFGKIAGVSGLSFLASKVGFSYPTGMRFKEVFVASMVAAIGLTVALFVAGQAFAPGTETQAAAKMGALFSGGICILALIVGKLLKVKGLTVESDASEETSSTSTPEPAVEA